MAISLKEQLRQLNEGVHYHAPFINVIKKGKEDADTREKATQMFYDFYAMELMHRLLGSPPPDPNKGNPKYAGTLTPQQASKFKGAMRLPNAAGAMFVPDWGDVEEPPMGVGIVPAQLRKVIDTVYEEVVIQLTRKMMAHLRLTLVSEFRYIVTHAKDWQAFRRRLVAIYNKNGGKISLPEFDAAISEKIPGMRGHEDAVKRLLKFCKHYDAMSPDPADAVPATPEPPKVGKPVKEPEPEPEPAPEPEPEEPAKPQAPAEPDDTDYNAPDIEVPPGADWEETPLDYSDEIEKLKTIQWIKQHQKLTEAKYDPSYAAGRISPHTVLAIKQAINASGLTWDDILLAYKNLHWGGAYGGPKWGEGVASFIKLMPQAKEDNVEQMAGLVDHIYDLEHNTGELLNKGGMYVAPSDLDRRAKVTSLARYLPNVSPLIQRLILRVMGYVSKHPDIEKDIRKVTQSPTVPFTPEEQTKLGASKFEKSPSGESWVTQAPYENKKGQTVQNQYTANHHTNGFYSVEDSIDADVQVFETWPEFEDWLGRNSNLFIKPQPGLSHYTQPKVQSAKEKFLSEKVKIKLDAEKETKLLDQCKMAWRPAAGSHYYKAYLPGDDRFQFFAFSDGTFMGCVKSTGDIGATFHDWHSAFEYCKAQTVNALPNEDYDEGKAWIGQSMTGPKPHVQPSSTIPLSPAVGSVPSTEYTLAPVEINTLQILASQVGGVTVEPNVMPEGVAAFKIQLDNNKTFYVLTVGKKAISPTGQKYVVNHAVANGTTESWNFANWNQALTFIKANFSMLTQAAQEVKGTVSTMGTTPSIFATQTAAPLPPPANSKAVYTAHLGVNKPPSHTIRLTTEDEQMMTGLGFEPKMVGSDVWYIHKTIGDTVKFFPNDVAKILFVKTNNSIVVTKKIDEALTWLQAKYAGATKSPIIAPQQPSNAGSKAGAMYEKMLADKQFSWDAATGKYFNIGNSDTIKIFPFPKSTFYDGNTGEQKTFGSLPALANFLKGYDGLKKKY